MNNPLTIDMGSEGGVRRMVIRILWRRTARPYYCYTCLLSWFEWAETKVNKCRRCGSRDIKAGRQPRNGKYNIA
jgi:DNA-directed RNA polymerase subunit RPC12/RpoP